MTEEIITALSKIPDLRVVARESAFQYKGEKNDIRAVGQALNATHLIGGSVRKVGDRVRITGDISPRYLAGLDGTVIELDDHASVRLERPVGRFRSGLVRCPPLALEKVS